MTRAWRLAVAVAAAVAVGGALVAVTAHVPRWTRAPFVAAAYLPAWDARAAGSLEVAARSGVSEVSPVWATVAPDGSLVQPPRPDGELAALRAARVRVLPTVQDLEDGAWAGQLVARLLSDPDTAGRHAEALLQAALAGGWAGVDVDYEQLPPTAGPAFTAFLADLRDRLHRHGMLLSVDVPARSADDGDEDTLAYPYQLIGGIADEVRVMAYDHAYATGDPGPVAPLPWVRDVVAYARDRIAPEKLLLGLAAYGYDWGAGAGADLGAADAALLAQRQGTTPAWHPDTASASFGYAVDGTRHTVWFEDARSLAAKQAVATANGLRGVAIWRLGGEDPRTWVHVATATGRSAR